MDVREAMPVSGSASYYNNRAVSASGGSGSESGGGGWPPAVIPAPPGFKPLSNPNLAIKSSVGGREDGISALQAENVHHGINMGITSSVTPGDLVKKKRGRPRKYGSDGVSLALYPLSSTPSPGSTSVGPKRGRGRPPGSGWKQKLAPLGEWMYNSAGQAFAPHVIHIRVGEDVSAKILAFAEQRPRALCILSANGTLSMITLRPPATSDGTITCEGRFDILRLSGSYLVSESGGPHDRIGGLSISVCGADGQVIGGAVGGRLTAVSPVQVVMCSFVHGSLKDKNKPETSFRSQPHSASTSAHATPNEDVKPNPAVFVWPPSNQLDTKSYQTGIDLARG